MSSWEESYFTGGIMNLTSSIEAIAAESLIFKTGTKLREIERVVILETLRSQKFNRTHAARVLGIGIRTLQRKLKRYGVSELAAASLADSEMPACSNA
jgi:DNA-binding NtrC family response regulator